MNKREFVNELVREAIIGANTANAIEEYLTAEDLLQSQKVTKPVTNDDCDKHPCPECGEEMKYVYGIPKMSRGRVCPTCGGEE